VAFAQTGHGEPSFSELDVNGDGRLSKEEAQADPRVAEAFEKADADLDGYLSLKEFISIWS
jgi:Ca2+-binding EF-hand superfamily protein